MVRWIQPAGLTIISGFNRRWGQSSISIKFLTQQCLQMLLTEAFLHKELHTWHTETSPVVQSCGSYGAALLETNWNKEKRKLEEISTTIVLSRDVPCSPCSSAHRDKACTCNAIKWQRWYNRLYCFSGWWTYFYCSFMVNKMKFSEVLLEFLFLQESIQKWHPLPETEVT